ncbi:hypothetical protein ACFVYE_14045 [Streptomyces sp. NPDC058239]|uniref:hypothetical protein n=1 Tax=Streptomyces sp. NPDC058239 TaxID=3346395 RepID=UPI0036E9D183
MIEQSRVTSAAEAGHMVSWCTNWPSRPDRPARQATAADSACGSPLAGSTRRSSSSTPTLRTTATPLLPARDREQADGDAAQHHCLVVNGGVLDMLVADALRGTVIKVSAHRSRLQVCSP